MLDQYGRRIDYLRISVTDRCNLRCVYCMPENGVEPLECAQMLQYEEILRLAGIFAELGIKKVRLTGGEPLVRKDVAKLVGSLKRTDGIEKVVLTTNGILLKEMLPELLEAGLDGVNISLDTLEEETFSEITRRTGLEQVIASVDAACRVPGLEVKMNCVPTRKNQSQLRELAEFAAARGIPIRFIEMMPIGEGKGSQGVSEQEVKSLLGIGAMAEAESDDGKCRYYRLPGGGRAGFISAVSHKFCENCNRIRLTSEGFLKTCLQYNRGVALKPLLAEKDEELKRQIAAAIWNKPLEHHFGREAAGEDKQDERRRMSQIGG